MEPSCPLGTTRRIPQESSSESHIINKSFIDQAYSVKMAGYWPRSFFACLWTSTPSQSINTHKRTWPISSLLVQTSLINNPYIFDRIVFVFVTFYQWGHIVMLIIRNLNLVNLQSWTYLLGRRGRQQGLRLLQLGQRGRQRGLKVKSQAIKTVDWCWFQIIVLAHFIIENKFK